MTPFYAHSDARSAYYGETRLWLSTWFTVERERWERSQVRSHSQAHSPAFDPQRL